MMNLQATAITPQPDLPPLTGRKERMGGLICTTVTALLLLCQPVTALAKDFTYSPDHCAFTITFPEKPVIEEKCETPPLAGEKQNSQNSCHEVVTFNQVFSAQSGMHIRVTCNPATEDQYTRYNRAELKSVLEKLLATDDVDEHKTTFDTLENHQVKRAGFLGYGKRKQSPAMIIGQLWLSPESIFTMQVELTGARDQKADAMLADILRSLKLADDMNKDGQNKQAPETDKTSK